MTNVSKKLYDCYTRLDDVSLKPSEDGKFVKVTVIKDENGFALKIHGKNFLRDTSADGAIIEFLNTYSNSSIEMILDELGYIPSRYLGKDEDDFVYWRREFTKRVNELSRYKSYYAAEMAQAEAESASDIDED